MKSNILRVVFLVIGSALLVISFQNCGQPGSLSTASTSLQKMDSDPLVSDVVDEMDNQDGLAQIPPVNDKKEKKYCEDLEEVLEAYACDDNGKKVLICHYPPGNAAARHEICISRNALQAHLNHNHAGSQHKDHMGPCDQEPVED